MSSTVRALHIQARRAWPPFTHYQLHNELPGTSRAPVYRDNEADYARVQTTVQDILDDALAEIAARLDTRGEGVPVVVHNPLAWPRSESVRLTVRLAESPQQLVVRNEEDKPCPRRPLLCAGRATTGMPT